MLRIAICDDEADTRSYLSSLIRRQDCLCKITEYASADDFLADFQRTDLLFLDINLDSKGYASNGITLAKELREQNPETLPVIIFVTGYDKYVFEAFDVNAFQYLLKPINESKFTEVFARAVKYIEMLQHYKPTPQMLSLQSANTIRTIPLDQIYYIESSNHKVVLHLVNGEFACYAKISDLEAKLQGQFFRIHKGYLVNLAFIESYSRTEALLTTAEKLLISKYKYRDFVKAYLSFLKKESGL
jgi:DNA-binding LytR/AlgR family response regulator